MDQETFFQKSRHGIMDDGEEGSLGSSYDNSTRPPSPSSEFTEDTASSGPLFAMSCLKEQLPFKRGLSRFYQGKSQSFTSFSDIACFEDLAKPRRPLKRLKASS